MIGAMRAAASQPADALTLQFLDWVDARPRCYAEAMEAWRSTCPRLSIWEDALRDGLVRLDRGDAGTMQQSKVTLTLKGRELLRSR